jgi:hypothetical protein
MGRKGKGDCLINTKLGLRPARNGIRDEAKFQTELIGRLLHRDCEEGEGRIFDQNEGAYQIGILQ